MSRFLLPPRNSKMSSVKKPDGLFSIAPGGQSIRGNWSFWHDEILNKHYSERVLQHTLSLLPETVGIGLGPNALLMNFFVECEV